MHPPDWWNLAFLCLAGALSPGLSWIVIISMSVSRGTLVGVCGALGHGFGVSTFALITVFGLSTMLALNPNISIFLNLAGVILLAYFGYSLVRSGHPPIPNSMSTEGGFIAGFSLAIINPKVLVFFIAVFGPFVDPTHTLSTQLSMGLLAGGIDMLVYLGVAIIGVMLKDYLQSTARLWINRSLGGLLMASSVWFLWKIV